MKTLGKLPKSRNDLNIESLMENLKEWGGDNVKVLDSNQMWAEGAFRAVFNDVEGFSADSAPERVVLFTTDALLSQLAQSGKWSQVIEYPFHSSSAYHRGSVFGIPTLGKTSYTKSDVFLHIV